MPNTQINHVTTVANQIQTNVSKQDEFPVKFEIVGLNEFIKIFKEKNSTLKTAEIKKLWYKIFGKPTANNIKNDNTVEFLTKSSANQIIRYLDYFYPYGIDFGCLPSGFYITNTIDSMHGVLHFDENVKISRPQTSKLALILDSEEEKDSAYGIDLRDFSLFNVLNSNKNIIFTTSQLQQAFKEFLGNLQTKDKNLSETLKEIRDWPKIPKDCNPIGILSRMNQIMLLPNLRPEDRMAQLKELSSLELNCGDQIFSVVRSANFHGRPLSFVSKAIQKLNDIDFLDYVPRFNNFVSENFSNGFEDLYIFYLCTLTERHPIDFYNKQFESLSEYAEENIINLIGKQKTASIKQIMLMVLFNGTTSQNYDSNKQESDGKNFKIFVEAITNLAKNSPKFIPTVGTIEKYDVFIDALGYFRSRKYSVPLDLHVTSYMSLYIKFKSSNVVTAAWNRTSLIEMAEKFNTIMKKFSTSVLHGYRFYSNNKNKDGVDFSQYVEEIHKINNNLSKHCIANISVFGKFKEDIFKNWFELFNEKADSEELVSAILNEFNQQIDFDVFKGKINGIPEINFESLVANFSDYLPEGFADRFSLERSEFHIPQDINALLCQHFIHVDQKKIVIALLEKLGAQAFLATNINKSKQIIASLGHISKTFDKKDFSEIIKNVSKSASLNLDNLSCFTKNLNNNTKVYFYQLKNFLLAEQARTSLIEGFNYLANNLENLDKEILQKLSYIKVMNVISAIVLKSEAQDDSIFKNINMSLQVLAKIAEKYPHNIDYAVTAISKLPVHNFSENLNKFIVKIEDFNTKLSDHNNDFMAAKVFYIILAKFKDRPSELIGINFDTAEELIALENILQVEDNVANIITYLNLIKKNDYLIKDRRLLPDYSTAMLISEEGQNAAYLRWSISPFSELRKTSDWGFNKQKYCEQLDRLKICGEKTSLYLGEKIAEKLAELRTKNIEELDEILKMKKIQGNKSDDFDLELLCLAIEYLSRSAYQVDNGKKYSQELNSTQVLALVANLNVTTSRVFSNIDTGEGKSRINMVLAAYQALKGKTVDFITSNMVLAERDYFKYQRYFYALGINSSLVSVNAPKELYANAGINFSDRSSLAIQRHIRKQNHDLNVMENACLIIDECDDFTHANAGNAFNLAIPDDLLKDYIWIYQYLLEYYEQANSKNLTETNFKEFILSRADLKPEQISAYEKLPKKQINLWLQKIVQAKSLEEKRDYLISIPELLQTDSGVEFKSSIAVLQNSRKVPGSTYTDGVHQLISADERRNNSLVHVPPESKVVLTSYPASFMQPYSKIYGVSGSVPKGDRSIQADTTFIDVPREKALKRVDMRPIFVKDVEDKYARINNLIDSHFTKDLHASVLIICEDDNKALELFQKLNLSFHKTLVKAGISSQEENDAIKVAGEPQKVTVSTAGMFSRGVDIRSQNLLVITDHLQTETNCIQSKGRAARFGQIGEYQPVLAISELGFKVHEQMLDSANSIQREMSKREHVNVIFQNYFANYLAQKQDKDNCAEIIKEKSNAFNSWLEQIDLANLSNSNIALKDILGYIVFDEQKQISYNQAFQSAESVLKNYNAMGKQLIIADSYQVGDDGQSIIYRKFFAETYATIKGKRRLFANTRAWLDGRGVLFANTKAILKGKKPLFANTRAWISSSTANKKIFVRSIIFASLLILAGSVAAFIPADISHALSYLNGSEIALSKAQAIISALALVSLMFMVYFGFESLFCAKDELKGYRSSFASAIVIALLISLSFMFLSIANIDKFNNFVSGIFKKIIKLTKFELVLFAIACFLGIFTIAFTGFRVASNIKAGSPKEGKSSTSSSLGSVPSNGPK